MGEEGDQVDQVAVRGAKRGDATGTQLSLPGFDAVPLPTDGLFFALFPDTRSAARIEQIAQHVCSRQQGAHAPAPLGLERYHVTLHHLGTYAGGLPQAVVARAIRAASTVSANSFAVAFDRAENFHGRPLVLRAHEGGLALIAFRFALGKALESAGFAGRSSAPFTPHVTLAYRNPREAKRRFVERLDEPVSWTVQDFVLVHSLLGRSRHIALARWPLHATT
ncbi:2'-5' RNA ligase family protein [Paraburkholderia solisilvae]|uniref:RNA 2',3'-cyclic phosphodiesterase n=1 Tax=Paraburkholderia solisilvae TaxID=624376 RepID=A0A6J5E0R5_9BURK|nr:2'-5' RNA ligase family protein [Paraburkholderia solisilvae]CAB3759061.1 RNA 2',3'-cyclic phosphodiesterase [Paraburkholderia solisilvae]